MKSVLRVLGAAVLALPTVLMVATPASARAELPDIAVTVTFDQATYPANAPVTVTFAFTNQGSVAGHNIHVTGGDTEGMDVTGAFPNGFDLEPGATHTQTAAAVVNDRGANIGRAALSVQYEADEGDSDQEDNIAGDSAQVIGAKGAFDGIVFDEAGAMPPATHIGVGCVTIALFNRFTPNVETARATTDLTGAFHLTNIPVGDYTFKVTMPAGYALGEKFPTTGTLVARDGVDPSYISAARTSAPVGACPPTQPATTTTHAPAAPILPVTGTPSLLIAGTGLGTVVFGVVLMLLVRRRRRADSVESAVTPG